MGFWLFMMSCASQPDALPYFNSPEFTPRWMAAQDVPADFHHVTEFSLQNQHGATINESVLDGRVTVVDFFFAACNGICPKLAESMSRVDLQLDSPDVVLLSYSVTPETDTVPVLAEYADARGITSSRWHLLTGDRALIYHLGREVYYVEEDMGVEKGPDDFLHTENLVLIDQNRRIRGVYNGLNPGAVGQLIEDAQVLLN